MVQGQGNQMKANKAKGVGSSSVLRVCVFHEPIADHDLFPTCAHARAA